MTAASELLDAALDLPIEDRIAMAQALMESTEHPPGPATPMTREELTAEMNRRAAETDPSAWSSVKDMMERVHKRLGYERKTNG